MSCGVLVSLYLMGFYWVYILSWCSKSLWDLLVWVSWGSQVACWFYGNPILFVFLHCSMKFGVVLVFKGVLFGSESSFPRVKTSLCKRKTTFQINFKGQPQREFMSFVVSWFYRVFQQFVWLSKENIVFLKTLCCFPLFSFCNYGAFQAATTQHVIKQNQSEQAKSNKQFKQINKIQRKKQSKPNDSLELQENPPPKKKKKKKRKPSGSCLRRHQQFISSPQQRSATIAVHQQLLVEEESHVLGRGSDVGSRKGKALCFLLLFFFLLNKNKNLNKTKAKLM